MTVLLHVIVALTSIVNATYLYFRPSRAKFYASYGLISATLASGTYLVIITHSPLLSSCLTGLIYLGIVLSALFAAYRKTASDS